MCNKKLFTPCLKIFLLFFLGLAFICGCASFQHLTTLQKGGKEGPKSADCGSCHLLQFQEWSGSPHAQAYVNESFQQAFLDGGDEECLGCHAPLEIRQGETLPRSFNRDEGITCISCHLSQGRMHGPHKSSALFHPHPVQEEDDFYLRVEICAACHGETYEEYRRIAEKREVQTCQQCHAAPKQRTATQGTNFLSKALVSLEDEVATRSHMIDLESMVVVPGAVHVAVLSWDRPLGQEKIECEIGNNLPHNLPTGTFGEKSIRLSLRFLKANTVYAEKTIVVSDEQAPLLAGDTKRFSISVPGMLQGADSMEVRLIRQASLASSRPAVILETKTISLSGEKMR